MSRDPRCLRATTLAPVACLLLLAACGKAPEPATPSATAPAASATVGMPAAGAPAPGPDLVEIKRLARLASGCSVAHFTKVGWTPGPMDFIVQRGKLEEMLADANALSAEEVARNSQFRTPGADWSIAASLINAFNGAATRHDYSPEVHAKGWAYMAYYETVGIENVCPLDPKVLAFLGKS